MSDTNDTNTSFQNAYYIANNFNTILYGIELALYFTSARLFLQNRRKTGGTRSARALLALSTGLLLMATLFVATQSVFGEEMWVVHADYPGGSAQYLADNAAVWYRTLGSAAAVVLHLMSTGLLIYRLSVIWGNRKVAIFPGLIYLGSIAIGILTCNTDSPDFFLDGIDIAYPGILFFLSALCAALICGRALSRSARTHRASAGGLAAESMLPYVACALAYLVVRALDRPYAVFFRSLFVMSACLAPQTVVLRMQMGRGWTRAGAEGTEGFVSAPEASANASTTRFTHGEDTGTALKSVATGEPDFGADSRV